MGGRRVPKSSPQVEIYGQIDELNAWMGLLAAEAGIPDVYRFLTDIQRDLFKIGGFYSFDFSEGKPYPYPFVDEVSVERLEKEIDRMQAGLPALRAFILPGGCLLAARAHVARTVCRRAERRMDAFDGVPDSGRLQEEMAKAYVNRLSDYLFVLARFFQHQSGFPDVLL